MHDYHPKWLNLNPIVYWTIKLDKKTCQTHVNSAYMASHEHTKFPLFNPLK